jgi:alpha- and gamma-adaptin-binding protein p34
VVPESASTTLAGTTHALNLTTAYYTASVPVWLDLISSPEEWAESFLSPEAKEVLEVLGGVVIVFPLPTTQGSKESEKAKELIQHVGKVVKEGLGGWEWDGVGLCLGVGELDDIDEWDECAAEWGLEFVQVRGKATDDRNEFGGTLSATPFFFSRRDFLLFISLGPVLTKNFIEKTGISRAREALEANDWAQVGGDLGSDLEDFETPLDDDDIDELTGPDGSRYADLDPESLDFGFDKSDFVGLRHAIWSAGRRDEDEEGDAAAGRSSQQPTTDADKTTATDKKEEEAELNDDEIQKLEGMMRKLQAVRDASAGLPEDQRKRMAAKAVNEVMKEL